VEVYDVSEALDGSVEFPYHSVGLGDVLQLRSVAVAVLDSRRYRRCESRGLPNDGVVIFLVIIKECTTRVVSHMALITYRHDAF
jgi:hypothetical protein